MWMLYYMLSLFYVTFSFLKSDDKITELEVNMASIKIKITGFVLQSFPN